MTSSVASNRLLVFGDVNGSFDTVFSRLAKIQSAHGPFTAALLLGRFLAPAESLPISDIASIIAPYSSQIPQTYIITGDDSDAATYDAATNGVIAPNVQLLRGSGIIRCRLPTLSDDVTIAYLCGRYDDADYVTTAPSTPCHYTESAVISLLQSAASLRVDVLATSEWPNGISADTTDDDAYSSAAVTKLLVHLQPRYHFAATRDMYLELPPFRTITYLTRFIALAHANNTGKRKGTYACNLPAWNSVDKTAFPNDMTPSPFQTTNSLSANVQSASRKRHRMDGRDDGRHDNQRSRPLPGFVKAGTVPMSNVVLNSSAPLAPATTDLPRSERWDFRPSNKQPPPTYICRICNEAGHWINDCPQKQQRPSNGDATEPPSGYVCNKCGETGHFIRQCPLIAQENSQRRLRPYVCRKCGVPGHFIQMCPLVLAENAARANAQPLADCWFCLATVNVAEHLIVSIGDETYVAIPKGSLVPQHLLLLPIVHVACTVLLTVPQRQELNLFKSAIIRYYHSLNLFPIIYERHIPTRAAQHMHLQIIPITKEQCENVENIVHEQAALIGIKFTTMSVTANNTIAATTKTMNGAVNGDHIVANNTTNMEDENKEMLASESTDAAPVADSEATVSTGDTGLTNGDTSSSELASEELYYNALVSIVGQRPYLYFELPTGVRLVFPATERVPGLFEFPRTLCAKIIGHTERADWKACETSVQEEIALVEQIKADFAPFDFTSQTEENDNNIVETL